MNQAQGEAEAHMLTLARISHHHYKHQPLLLSQSSNLSLRHLHHWHNSSNLRIWPLIHPSSLW